MATKRSFSEEFRPHLRTDINRNAGAIKRRKFTDHKQTQLEHRSSAGRPFKKAHPVNDLKSQIRSLRRLLSRSQDVLPANVRVEKERALRTAERDLAAAERAKNRSEVIGKWHKIRFFERQKAGKRLKKAKKLLEALEAGNTDDGVTREELEERVRDAETEVNYALYFPLEKDYVRMFSKTEDGAIEERKGDQEMWNLVKKCMLEENLEKLREGRLQEEVEEVDQDSRARSRSGNAGIGKRNTKRKEKDEQEDDNDNDVDESDNESGGGFFE